MVWKRSKRREGKKKINIGITPLNYPQMGKIAVVHAIVVGALGSWDPDNDKTIRRLCSGRYAKLMKKIIVSETTAHSQDAFDEHMRRIPQNTDGRRV